MNVLYCTSIRVFVVLDIFSEIRAKVSIVDFISSYVRLARKGRDWFGLCPFHSEKTPSFKVNDDSGRYYCFGCGASGDAVSFLSNYNHCDVMVAVEEIADRYGLDFCKKSFAQNKEQMSVTRVLELAQEFFHQQLYAHPEILDYVYKRGYNDEIIARFAIGYAPVDGSMRLRNILKSNDINEDLIAKSGLFSRDGLYFSGRLTFGLHSFNNKITGFGARALSSEGPKYLNSRESDVFHKSEVFFGYNVVRANRAKQLVIAEGYFDVLALHKAGFDGAMSVSGTCISESQILQCWKMCSSPIVCLDSDFAGIKATHRWCERIMPLLEPSRTFRFALLAKGHDPDSMMLGAMGESLQKSVENAKDILSWLWETSFMIYPTKSAEDRAKIISSIRKMINTVSNRDLRTCFEHELRSLISSTFFHNSRHHSKQAIQVVSNVMACEKREVIERILLLILIKRHNIYTYVEEYFALIAFKDENLQAFASKVLCDRDSLLHLTELERDFFAKIEQGVASHLSAVLDCKLRNDLVGCWLHLWNVLMLSNAGDAMAAARNGVCEEASQDSWERFKFLKNEMLNARMK